jgi:glycosyltransferase involved in cell wall biosynthesis
MPPTICAIIPTPGHGRPLDRCLASIAPQLQTGDQVIVVGDTHDCPEGLPDVERLVAELGPQFRYVPLDAGYHGWGHPQINLGIALAKADYVTFNDDDDVYTPDAFELIRQHAAALTEPKPLLFRFTAQWGMTYWIRGEQQKIAQDLIGGHCAVFPNVKERLGLWSDRYQGDFDFIRSTLDLWPNGDADAVWVDAVIAIARPAA